MPKQFARKNYLINKDLQGHYIFYFVVLILIACLLYTFIIGYVSSDSMSVSYGDEGIEIVKTSTMLWHNLIKVQWIFMLTGGVGAVAVGTLLTHRFAGPLYKFERTLEAMINGNHSSKIYLRPKDEGQKLAELINNYNKQLTEDLKIFKNSTSILRDHLNDVTDTSGNEELINALTAVHQIENRLRRFRINF